MSRRVALLAGGILTLAAFAAYHNSFNGPFILDDVGALLNNPSIRHLGRALSPPYQGGLLTVSGRPLLNLSFALNYAFGGLDVRGYHILNLVIHLFAGLTLFGIVRRTLRLCSEPALRLRPAPLALAVAVLWTVHPLQTESVTYVVQRAESLMGLFYLLTLYCFIRGTESPSPGPWPALSLAACLSGMATKEVMASAPLMVLLYDRTFVAGTFREAWRRRWRLYAGLACTWLLLGWLVAGTGGNRGGTVGFGTGIPWWAYAATQFRAIVHYLWLSVWPHPLVFEYGTGWIKRAAEIVPYALILALPMAGTVIGLRRWPAAGFMGAWFFAILAPTSLAPGTTQMIVEHRMYLSLAAVITLGVLGLHAWMGRRSLVVCLVLAAGLAWLTFQRNEDYRSGLAIWSDTVTKRPRNAVAHNNLGIALVQADRVTESIAHFEQALRLMPNYVEAHDHLGNALVLADRMPEALWHYQQALRLQPDHPNVHYNFGAALLKMDRVEEATGHFERALRLKPDFADVNINLGHALIQLGRPAEAREHYQQALWLRPDLIEAHIGLGVLLAQTGRVAEAIAQYETVLRLNPGSVEARNNLGNALFQAGRMAEAWEQYEQVLRLQPDHPDAHVSLGTILAQTGRVAEAIAQYETVLRLNPGHVQACSNLGVLLLQAGRVPEAISHYEETARLKPDDALAHYNLGNALFQAGRLPEAAGHYERALRINPDYAVARNNLGGVLFKLGRMQEAIGQYEQVLRTNPADATARGNLELIRRQFAGPAAGP